MSSITAVLITLNEEHSIRGVLDNLRTVVDDIVIVDSFSSDDTVKIAKTYAARVFYRKFEGFGDQWNFAINETGIKTRWTMKIDPDERLSKELIESIKKNVLNAENKYSAFSFTRVLWFGGRPIYVNDVVTRIWLTGKCEFTNSIVNEHPVILGKTKHLKGKCEHLDSPNLFHWLNKQNSYTTKEACARFNNQHKLIRSNNLFHHVNRRIFLKRIFPYIPFKYTIYFIYCLLIKGSFKGGYNGLMWARMRVFVFRMRSYKYFEMKQSERNGNN